MESILSSKMKVLIFDSYDEMSRDKYGMVFVEPADLIAYKIDEKHYCIVKTILVSNCRSNVKIGKVTFRELLLRAWRIHLYLRK